MSGPFYLGFRTKFCIGSYSKIKFNSDFIWIEWLISELPTLYSLNPPTYIWVCIRIYLNLLVNLNILLPSINVRDHDTNPKSLIPNKKWICIRIYLSYLVTQKVHTKYQLIQFNIYLLHFLISIIIYNLRIKLWYTYHLTFFHIFKIL